MDHRWRNAKLARQFSDSPLTFKASSATLTSNSGEWLFRFDISDLLLGEDQ
jgi:hypothetical protein